MMDFVWPYSAANAEGREIELSIASVLTFFQGEALIWVIGDDPKVFGARHLEAPKQSNKWIDVIYKILTAIDHPKIKDDFVWMNDDMYFLKPFTAEDLAVPFSNGLLSEYDYTNSLAGDYYKQVMKDTMMEIGGNMLNFESHSPRLYSKKFMASVIADYNLMDKPMNLATTYFNSELIFHKANDANTFKASIPYPITEGFEELCADKLWLNHTHGAYNTHLEKYLISIINPNLMSKSKNAAANVWLKKVEDFLLYNQKKGLTTEQEEQRSDLYQEGVGIYMKLGKNRVLQSTFQRKENDQTRLKLQYELQKLRDPNFVVIEESKGDNDDQKASSGSDHMLDAIHKLAPRDFQKQVMNQPDPSEPAQSLRQNFRIDYTPEAMAHINYQDLPEDMKALFDANRNLTKQLGMKHAELVALGEDPAKQKERSKLVKKLHQMDDDRAANWTKINAWFDGKEVKTEPKKPTVIRWTKKKIDALEDPEEKTVQKLKRIKSNKQYIKRNEKNKKKAKEVAKRLKELKEWNVELD